MKNNKVGPKFLRFINPLVEVLRLNGGVGRPSEIRPLVTKKLNISEVEINQTVGSGVSKIYNQIDWARYYLREWGFISAEERGIWRLTIKDLKKT